MQSGFDRGTDMFRFPTFENFSLLYYPWRVYNFSRNGRFLQTITSNHVDRILGIAYCYLKESNMLNHDVNQKIRRFRYSFCSNPLDSDIAWAIPVTKPPTTSMVPFAPSATLPKIACNAD